MAASQHFRIQTQFAGTSPATLETGSPFLQDSALLGQAPPFGRGFGRFPAPSSGLQRAPQNHVYLRRAGRRPEALENSSPLRTAAAPSITSLTSAALYGRKDSSKQSLQRAGNSRPPASVALSHIASRGTPESAVLSEEKGRAVLAKRFSPAPDN